MEAKVRAEAESKKQEIDKAMEKLAEERKAQAEELQKQIEEMKEAGL